MNLITCTQVLGLFCSLLYINDLPLVSNFNITLFAGEILLSLADKNLSNLEHSLNDVLKKISGFKQKVSLNLKKTTT